jgi:hypothetical protein
MSRMHGDDEADDWHGQAEQDDPARHALMCFERL